MIQRPTVATRRSRATLDIRPARDIAPDATRYEIGCPHGETVAIHLPGRSDFSVPQWVLALLVKHELEERCGCVEALYIRYGTPVYRAYGTPLPSLRAIGLEFDRQCTAAGVA